ncbi:MAG: YbhB/YbcL family Raf kinase inhibitor-like protein [Candidatus Baltobacteraceae bacterium]
MRGTHALFALVAAASLLLGGAPIGSSFRLGSTSFRNDRRIPRSAICRALGGENRSPELHWSDPPAGTKSFALLVHDSDAPRPGGWWHWGIYNIPSTVRSIPAAGRIPGRQAIGSSHQPRYNGPCPPPGKVHHYHFTLYALDRANLGGNAPLTAKQLARLAALHAIARSRLTGLFSAPSALHP